MAFSDNGSYIKSEIIAAPHVFTTRLGGTSEGIFASLNLSVDRDDEPERVRENYRRVLAVLEREESDVFLSRQVHRDDVRAVTAGDLGRGLFAEREYEADALMTDVSGAVLVIFIADCTPILLHDPVRGVAAAVHAGWRGTVLDIAGKTVREMKRIYGCLSENITAAIGPCISRCCYETGNDVHDAVAALGAEYERFCTPHGGKWMTDLKGINRRLLISAGLSEDNIDVSSDCTFCLSDKYWSHRVTNGRRGSQTAMITL